MTNSSLASSALHRVTRLLAGQPGDNIQATVRQSLQALCEMVPLAAAGIIWKPSDGRGCPLGVPIDDDGYQLDIRWPEANLHPDETLPWLRLDRAGDTLCGVPPERNGDTSWLNVPLEFAGVATGRLWAIPQPGRQLDDHDRAILWLAAGQFGLACRNADLSRELVTQHERQDSLVGRLVQVSEECRRHVAGELHDGISQSLAALIFQVDTAQAILPTNVNSAAHSLAQLRQGLVRLVDEVQRLVLELRPALLEQKGLLEALRWYGLQYLQPLQMQFYISGGKCAPHLSPLMRLTLYRIGQEAIANAARHSDAANVWLEIACRDNLLTLTIRDDGRGFDPAVTLAHPQGMKGIGLQNMQERALLLGGALTVDSASGRGACVQLRVPIEAKCPS